MAAFPRYRSALSSGGESTTRLPAASLQHASSGPPTFASAALHGGFSSLSLGALFGRRVYDSPPSSKPPACFFRAAYVRFRRPPWRLFLAIARRSLREASLRLAPLQQQASSMLLPGPPTFASAALHGGFSSLSLGALFGRRVYDSPPSSKPPASFFRAAYVRFRRPPWRLFLAIARRSLREASLRLASQQQASC